MKISLEYITPNAEEFIGKMAAICYDANLDPDACVRRAAKCSREGHLATLRFAHATFNISGISRVCSHQLVRSKHLDILQRSQRYCREGETDFVVPPSAGMLDGDIMSRHNDECLSLYKRLLERGVKKEDARFVLPEATHTEMNVVGNLQAWMDFIKLRDDPHAQWEIRSVARTINNILAEHCPNIFHWKVPYENPSNP